MIKKALLLFCLINSRTALSINEELIHAIRQHHAAVQLAEWKRYKKEWKERLSTIQAYKDDKRYEEAKKEKMKLKKMSKRYRRNYCDMNEKLNLYIKSLRQESDPVVFSKL